MATQKELALYDKAFQLAAGCAWIVLGLLGWSLERQVDGVEAKISALENSIESQSSVQTTMVAAIAEFKANLENHARAIADFTQLSRDRGNQVERMSVTVNELLEIEREQRRQNLEKQNKRGEEKQ